ncbi:hypothetical protein T484DRAFT_1892275, partial [Baffinella frigidus]
MEGKEAAGAGGATSADLEQELEAGIECLRQALSRPAIRSPQGLGIHLETSKAENETVFFDKINKLIAHYKSIYSMRDAVTGSVPFGVISEYLDQELSPELFTKHRLQAAEALNQQGKGRVDSLR